MDELRAMDTMTQRRVVLQAAKATSPFLFEELKKRALTVAEVEKDWSDALWGSVLLFWTVFIPLLCLPAALPSRRLARYLKAHWREHYDRPDAECKHLALVGEIRAVLSGLPKARREQAEEVEAELQRASARWYDLTTRLARIREAVPPGQADALAEQSRELERLITGQPDSLTQTALAGQQAQVEGQRDAVQDLLQWRNRLEAAERECTQALLHLRARLGLLAATGGFAESTEISNEAASLHDLNTRLASTQDAVEEVMQIQAGS